MHEMTILLPTHLLAQIDSEAKRRGVSRSRVIRDGLPKSLKAEPMLPRSQMARVAIYLSADDESEARKAAHQRGTSVAEVVRLAAELAIDE